MRPARGVGWDGGMGNAKVGGGRKCACVRVRARAVGTKFHNVSPACSAAPDPSAVPSSRRACRPSRAAPVIDVYELMSIFSL